MRRAVMAAWRAAALVGEGADLHRPAGEAKPAGRGGAAAVWVAASCRLAATRRRGDVEPLIGLVRRRDHVQVALRRPRRAEHDADQAGAAADGRGDEIEAGGIGVAGLDAVGALVGREQVVVRR
jgi:hypothetical protein